MRGGAGVRMPDGVVRDGAALVGDDPRGLRDVEGRAPADPDDHVEAAVPHAIRQLVGEREGRLARPLDDAVEPHVRHSRPTRGRRPRRRVPRRAPRRRPARPSSRAPRARLRSSASTPSPKAMRTGRCAWNGVTGVVIADDRLRGTALGAVPDGPRPRARRRDACRPPSRGARERRPQSASRGLRAPRACRPPPTPSRRAPPPPGPRPGGGSTARRRDASPRIDESLVPSFTSTGCSEKRPSSSRWPSCPTDSGRCWTRSPPRSTFSSWNPRQIASVGTSRSSARSSSASSPASRWSCAGSVCRVTLGAIGGRVDVDPAREDDAVEDVERLVDRVGARRDDERPSTGPLDRLDVEERDERRGQLPRAPARRLCVGRDPDQRPLAHSTHATR